MISPNIIYALIVISMHFISLSAHECTPGCLLCCKRHSPWRNSPCAAADKSAGELIWRGFRPPKGERPWTDSNHIRRQSDLSKRHRSLLHINKKRGVAL